ncbi:hypothetical protein M433DRAFT_148712 [Acidomyces richmondensis BFW]|nr:MAG: hypothetical protein FE78DRAFT_80232 [Acidomyces sp. 'richmondensis']KYG50596.1 hypothetical protein M433DRAFT_148712 [Acidomyces richmondensis BFW]
MAGSLSGYINTAIKLGEFILRLQAAPEECRVFGRLIQRVRTDRAEALRERHDKSTALEDFTEKRKWIDDTIQDATEALQTIGRLVEGARIDVARGKKVSLRHRFEWVLSCKDDFLAKQSLLATCHQSLILAISFLQSLSFLNSSRQLPPPPAYIEDGPALMPPSLRKPALTKAFFLPDQIPREGTSWTDEWERSFANSTIDQSNETLDQTLDEKDSSWDDVSAQEAANAAAAAMLNLGGNSLSVTAIATSLQQSYSNKDRRRRRQAQFEDSDVAQPVGCFSQNDSTVTPTESLIRQRKERRSAFFQTE